MGKNYFPTSRDSAGYRGGNQDPNKDYTVPRIPSVKPSVIKGTGRSASGFYSDQTPIRSFKNGGKVPKTGVYKLHKGERVISKKQLEKIVEKHLFSK